MPSVANAHNVLATACELKETAYLSAADDSVANSVLEGGMPRVANAHSVLATSCELKETADLSAADDSAANSVLEGGMPSVANAHNVLATCCGLKETADLSTLSHKASQRAGLGRRLSLAKDQKMFEISLGLNSSIFDSIRWMMSARCISRGPGLERAPSFAARCKAVVTQTALMISGLTVRKISIASSQDRAPVMRLLSATLAAKEADDFEGLPPGCPRSPQVLTDLSVTDGSVANIGSLRRQRCVNSPDAAPSAVL